MRNMAWIECESDFEAGKVEHCYTHDGNEVENENRITEIIHYFVYQYSYRSNKFQIQNADGSIDKYVSEGHEGIFYNFSGAVLLLTCWSMVGTFIKFSRSVYFASTK